MIIIDYPPIPKGSPEEQLYQMYRYLFRLAEALNLAYLNNADTPKADKPGGNGASP